MGFIAGNGFEEVWQEKSGGGGYRVPIGVEEYPEYATMAATPGGKLMGEIRGYGSFAVLAPTKHPNGKYYERLVFGGIPLVKNLESIGIYASAITPEQAKESAKKERTVNSKGEYQKTASKRNDVKGFAEDKEGDLVSFLNESVLPALEPEQIYNWEDHISFNTVISSKAIQLTDHRLVRTNSAN